MMSAVNYPNRPKSRVVYKPAKALFFIGGEEKLLPLCFVIASTQMIARLSAKERAQCVHCKYEMSNAGQTHFHATFSASTHLIKTNGLSPSLQQLVNVFLFFFLGLHKRKHLE